MARLLRWSVRQVLRPMSWFRRHFWKIGFWAITLVTLAWQYENWHGRNFLAKERALWIAEYGDITQLPAKLPALPDEVNFFAAPVFETFVRTIEPPPPSQDPIQAAYDQKVRNLQDALPHARFLNMAFPEIAMAPGTVAEKAITPGLSLPDFAAWAQEQEKSGLTRPAGLSDAAWLHSLMPEDPTVNGLLAALSRPESEELPTGEELRSIGEQLADPGAIPIPSRSGFFSRAIDLVLRARAAAAVRDGRTARDLSEVLLRFAEAPSRTETLVFVLVGIAVEGEALKAISAGIAARCWNESDLLHLAARLNRLDEEQFLRRGFYVEAFRLHQLPVEQTRAWFRRETKFPSIDDSPYYWFSLSKFITVHGPESWIDANLANHLHWWRAMLTPDIPGDDLIQLYTKLNQGLRDQAAWYAQPATPRNVFAKILVPDIGSIPKRALENQTLRRQLLLAIAVERFILENKAQPSSAEQLVPRYLPALPGDPWTPGKPLRYQAGEAGERYRLISAGPEAILAFPSCWP